MNDVTKREDAFLSEAEGLGYDGFENVSMDMLSMPFLKVAQPTSDEIVEGTSAYIPGLKAGEFFNSVSRERYGNELDMVILYQESGFIEWEDKTFVARFTHEEVQALVAKGDVAKQEDGYIYVRKLNGNEIKENHTFFVMLTEHMDAGPLLLSFKGTGLKHVRKWLTFARAQRIRKSSGEVIPAPLYSVVWRVKTVLNSNKEGNWYLLGDKNVNVKRVGDFTDETYFPGTQQILDAVRFVMDVKTKINYKEQAGDGIEEKPLDEIL